MSSNASGRIFICYSHRDEDVKQDIDWLVLHEYPIWYDERIHPGAEWADEIAEIIDACQLLLFFASNQSISSTHCRNEIAYAAGQEKPIITVFCEPMELAGGLKLTIARSQAIVRWQLGSEEYQRQLRYAVEHNDDQYKKSVIPAAIKRPRICYLPMRRNSSFSGRVELLAQIQHKLESVNSLALIGQAGVGKTQLALEYAYRYLDAFDTVAWIRAQDPATLDADFTHLAGELGLITGEVIDTPHILDAVKVWLSNHSNWFLILDNVEDPDIIRRYLPAIPTGQLLITSRRQTWGRLAVRLDIETFSEAEAMRFLLEQTRQEDQESAATLTRTLGYLPLALEEAAAYIETTGRSLDSYLQLFEAHHTALMENTPPVETYHSTLRTTLEVSLAQVDMENPTAGVLLRHLAFLAPDDIPISVLYQIDLTDQLETSELPAELMIDQCIIALRRYSLIKVDQDALSTHRLTQLVIRDNMDPALSETISVNTLNLISGLFPNANLEKVDLCRRLLPHAFTVLSHAEEIPSAAINSGLLLGRAGHYLSARNMSQNASELLSKAHHIFRELPDQQSKYARTCELYGQILYENGSLDHSMQVFEEAFPIFEAEGPRGLQHLLQIQVNLAWVLWSKGEFSQAKQYAEKSLALLESVLGPEHPLRAISLSIISRLELELGNASVALENIEKVALLIPQIPATDKERVPLLCAAFLQMAHVLQSLGFPLRAESWARESISFGKTIYSEYHSLMGATRCVLGQVLMDMGDYERAQIELESAAECANRHRQPVSQHILLSIPLLAITLVERGETEAAEALFLTRMQDIDKQVAGESAQLRALVLLARGWLESNSGNHSEAIQLCQAGDGEITFKHGDTCSFRLFPLKLIATCLRRGGLVKEATEAHELALKIAQELKLESHPHYAAHLEGLAIIAADQENQVEAVRLFEDSLNVYKRCFNPSNEPVTRLRGLLDLAKDRIVE
jgi:tetratricopeptide (TPR) repeat protein